MRKFFSLYSLALVRYLTILGFISYFISGSAQANTLVQHSKADELCEVYGKVFARNAGKAELKKLVKQRLDATVKHYKDMLQYKAKRATETKDPDYNPYNDYAWTVAKENADRFTTMLATDATLEEAGRAFAAKLCSIACKQMVRLTSDSCGPIDVGFNLFAGDGLPNSLDSSGYFSDGTMNPASGTSHVPTTVLECSELVPGRENSVLTQIAAAVRLRTDILHQTRNQKSVLREERSNPTH